MLSMNAHLTNWIPICVPMDSWLMTPPPCGYWPAAVGPATGMFPAFFKFYDLLGGFCSPNSFIMTPNRAYDTFPQLSGRAAEGKTLKYASVFYEGQHNDARTNLAIALTAACKGVDIANYTAAVLRLSCVG